MCHAELATTTPPPPTHLYHYHTTPAPTSVVYVVTRGSRPLSLTEYSTVWGGCGSEPGGCIFVPNPTVPERQTTVPCCVWGRQWAGWLHNQQYSKLLRCHQQWCLSSAASPTIGRLTRFLLPALFVSALFAGMCLQGNHRQNMLLKTTTTSKDHHCTLICANAQTSER